LLIGPAEIVFELVKAVILDGGVLVLAIWVSGTPMTARVKGESGPPPGVHGWSGISSPTGLRSGSGRHHTRKTPGVVLIANCEMAKGKIDKRNSGRRGSFT
jgi:hypothetical protein